MTQLFLTIIAVALTLLPDSAWAENSAARHVTIVSEEALVSAYGLIVTDRPAKQGDSNTREVALSKDKKNRWKLTVVLKPEDLSPGSRFTAVGITRSGRAIPTEVQWVLEPEPTAFVSTRCSENRNAEEDKKLRTLSREELETLSQIRQTRAQILARKLRETLNIQAIAQLTALEKELGFSYPRTLSKDLPLADLAYRIGVIEALLKSR